jgi:hypothetical protein
MRPPLPTLPPPPQLGVGFVPAPYIGLRGFSNYCLYSNCNPLIDLSVTIAVTQDIICESATGSTLGFGFQLNAYSAKNYLCGWQQYVISLFDPGGLVGAVNNWTASPTALFENQIGLGPVPSPFPTPAKFLPPAKIPAGYTLQISLQNDANKNVSGVTYVVTDNRGNLVANASQTLLSIPGVTQGVLAPIVAFQLNLVGLPVAQTSTLSSGAGTITYASPSGLAALQHLPKCAQAAIVTGENANSAYGQMGFVGKEVFPSLAQSFTVGGKPPPMSAARKPGKAPRGRAAG